MPKLQFTDITVRNLKPGTYFDTKTPAFGMRVGKHRRTWIVVKGAKSDKQTIGHYPDMALSSARRLALTALGSPYAPKADSVTFAEARDAFLEENYRGKGERTKNEATRLLARLSFTGRLDDIDDTEINRKLSKLSHVPSEQLHAFRVLRTMLRWCMKPPHRFIKHSPLDGYSPPSQDRKGTRVLSDQELTKLWNACEGQFGAMVKLLILWGTRNGETARIRREWVQDGVLTIPGEITKNGRAHAIPLLPIASSILDSLPNYGSYYFPARYDEDDHFNDGSWTKCKRQIDRKSGVKGYQIRDIRRTFRSGLSRLGVSRDLCEIMLNHVTGAGKTELDEIYDRYDFLAEKRLTLAKWEQHVSSFEVLHKSSNPT